MLLNHFNLKSHLFGKREQQEIVETNEKKRKIEKLKLKKNKTVVGDVLEPGDVLATAWRLDSTPFSLFVHLVHK